MIRPYLRSICRSPVILAFFTSRLFAQATATKPINQAQTEIHESYDQDARVLQKAGYASTQAKHNAITAIDISIAPGETRSGLSAMIGARHPGATYQEHQVSIPNGITYQNERVYHNIFGTYVRESIP